MKKLLLLPLAGAALAAAPAWAQRPIVPGELTRGTLSTSDPRLSDDTYYDEYVFAGRRGETVVVSMESSAFDTYLYVGTLRAGRFQQLGTDDDGGNGRNSRLELRLPDDGTYVVRASSVRRATGPYTLSLVGGRAAPDVGRYEPPPVEPYRPGRGEYGDRDRDGYISAGRPVRGSLSASDPTLDNGAYFHLYTYAGRRGERLIVTLRSNDFDSYLVLGTHGGRHGVQTALARDDDGGGERDSRIDFTVPEDGDYVIRVAPLLKATGSYLLEVESSLDRGGYGYDDGYDYEQAPLDRRLIGRWGLAAPGARVQSGSWSSVTAAASMGILTIDASGGYTWRKNGRLLRGELEPIMPRRDADPRMRYYVIDDGRDDFYVFFTERRGEPYMQVNNLATNVVVAYGYPDPSSR